VAHLHRASAVLLQHAVPSLITAMRQAPACQSAHLDRDVAGSFEPVESEPGSEDEQVDYGHGRQVDTGRSASHASLNHRHQYQHVAHHAHHQQRRPTHRPQQPSDVIYRYFRFYRRTGSGISDGACCHRVNSMVVHVRLCIAVVRLTQKKTSTTINRKPTLI